MEQNHRIGITYHSSKSINENSINPTALVLGKLFLRLGYSVIFVNTKYSQETVLTLSFETASSEDLHKVTNLSLLIDIDGLIHGDARLQASVKTVVFLRTFLQFSEMDNSVYIESPYTPRSMENVSEVWCWDVLNPPETIPSIQTLFPCPIRRVPFVWKPLHTDRPLNIGTSGLLTVHVTEENKENTSSSIIPLVAIRELCSKKILPDATYIIHNMQHIKDNKFLKENVLDNIKFSELPLTFSEDKKPLSYWELHDGQSVVLSHSRFVLLRISLLDAISYGVPVVHNSPFIRDLHPTLAALYYKGNELSGVCSVFTDFKEKHEGFVSRLGEIREAMQCAFGIEAKMGAWKSVAENVVRACNPNTFPQRPLSLPNTPSVNPLCPPPAKSGFVLAFCDMWPGFPFEQNYFIDAMKQENPLVIGVEYKEGVKCDVLMFGPFGSVWKTADPSVPKVYFSAENVPLPTDTGISLYLTSNSENHTENHIRIPTWHIFIDWFTAETGLPSQNSSDNPIRLPLHLATHPHPNGYSKRSSFCGFVVSNPICDARNKAFDSLNSYRTVDSGGALYNNIGGLLSLKYPGGGGGDVSKHHFFAEKKFSISFENSQADGYVTEKLLHAKMAGCVPLYWGSDTALTDFAPNSFVNLSANKNPGLIVDIVKKLESRPDLCEVLSSTPILDADRVQNALGRMKEMSLAILGLVQQEEFKDTFVINLDSRKDRMESLCKSEPSLVYTRIPAVNGLELTITPFLYRTFERNTFHWKKSVIGCFLSHMMAWKKIVDNPTPSLKITPEYTLILEDDVRFVSDWKKKLHTAMKAAPSDAELLYLGGVLPPNKTMLSSVLEPVNHLWSAIKPNKLFSSLELPLFHFCAYSYVLTVHGARKLLQAVESNTTVPPCDHFIMGAGLKTYVATSLLTYCFQEEDAKYCTAQFNNLLVTDSYDSNISNNVECFTEQDISNAVTNIATTTATTTAITTATTTANNEITVYTLHPITELYEQRWLEEILGFKIKFVEYECQTDKYAWYLVQRPHIKQWTMMFQGFEKLSIPFNILHMSDEFCKDDVSFYSYSMCNRVIRNYLRGDVYGMKNVLTVPLGYHHKSKTGLKSYKDRTLTWSFHGTDWFGRSASLSTLQSFVPYSCHLQPDWNHPTMTREEMYAQTLGNSKFCPILRGNNMETFRLYEALEAGCLPVTPIDDTMYIGWIEENIGLSSLYPWTNPIVTLSDTTTDYEAIRKKVGDAWLKWKDRVKRECLIAQITRYEPLE